jgi:hypothetical protein
MPTNESIRKELSLLKCVQAGWAFGVPEDGREQWLDMVAAVVYGSWRSDMPPEHGYYLGAWRRGGRWFVSELWFNPDSTGTGWWPTRSYLTHDTQSQWLHDTIEVEAWMPVPEYHPEEKA